MFAPVLSERDFYDPSVRTLIGGRSADILLTGHDRNPRTRMCLKHLPNTTRGIKPMITKLINEMEMKNASYAADLFAIEKNGLN